MITCLFITITTQTLYHVHRDDDCIDFEKYLKWRNVLIIKAQTGIGKTTAKMDFIKGY